MPGLIAVASFALILVALFFGATALRNYFTNHYSSAASHVRRMAKGHSMASLPASRIPEARDLYKAIYDLSQELQAQAKMIEKLERMRIDFVANVSHELKTPLTSIKGYTETLKSGALKDPEVGPQFLERIEENTNRLNAIISDLLFLSHAESFPGDVTWKIIETSDLSQKLYSTFMPALEKKNQKLTVRFDDEKIEGDPQKLEHIFINLIDNAIRYCPSGTTITVKQTKEPLHWLAEVSDNGPGIPKQHQSRIFERFYRVDADRSRETGGTGLGLAIVKHIVALHDGRIELDSETGRGTTFRIQWPRRQI